MSHFIGVKRDCGPFICKCGEEFRQKRYLCEHIALSNPRWPRISDDDEHRRVLSRKEIKRDVA